MKENVRKLSLGIEIVIISTLEFMENYEVMKGKGVSQKNEC